MIELNKIYNEDCLSGMKKIPDGSVNLVVTSPPYDNLRKYGGVGRSLCFEKFKDVALEIKRVLVKGGVCVWIVSDGCENGSESGTSFRQALYFKECGLNLYDTMIWEKPSPQAPTEGRYYDVFEYMFVLCKGSKPTHLNLIADHENISIGSVSTCETRSCAEDRKQTGRKRVVKERCRRFNVWKISRDQNKTGHPAVYPFRLARDHIISWSNEGDTVLDPFIGSGTTAIAAIREKRNFIGFELNEEYYDKACKRIRWEMAQQTLF